MRIDKLIGEDMELQTIQKTKQTHILTEVKGTGFAIATYYHDISFVELLEWDQRIECYIPYFEDSIFESYAEAMDYLIQ